jgi:hypothetical protein
MRQADCARCSAPSKKRKGAGLATRSLRLRLGEAVPQDAPAPVRVTRPRRLVLRRGALEAAADRVVRRAAVARGLRAVRRRVVAAAGAARLAVRRRVVVVRRAVAAPGVARLAVRRRVVVVRRAAAGVARLAVRRLAVVRRAGLRPGRATVDTARPTAASSFFSMSPRRFSNALS